MPNEMTAEELKTTRPLAGALKRLTENADPKRKAFVVSTVPNPDGQRNFHTIPIQTRAAVDFLVRNKHAVLVDSWWCAKTKCWHYAYLVTKRGEEFFRLNGISLKETPGSWRTPS